MKGTHPACPEGRPFHDAELISLYTSEQAVEDGVKIRLGERLWCTTNFARSVATKWFVKRSRAVIAGPFDSDAAATHALHNLQPQSATWTKRYDGYSVERDIDSGMLRQIVSSIVSEYVIGAYAVPRRADKHEEADAALAAYLVTPGRGLVDEDAAPSADEVRVWALRDPDGLHILLPEDY